MNTFAMLFIVALILGLAVDWWLMRRQAVAVLAHRSWVPEAFRDHISLPEHQKAADYTVAKLGLGAVELFMGTLWLLLWTLGGGLSLLDQVWRGMELPMLWTGVGFIMSVVLLMTLLDLPFAVYRTFVVEQRFGFNRTKLKTFTTDLLKHTALALALGVPLAAVILWLMGQAGWWWWLYAWLIWTGFGLLMMWAYPAFIAPLFNKFSPLEDESLRVRIQSLLQRSGFTSKGIFVMDGSSRSAHGNAYFTGLGANKRIVFFDTLINTLAADEIEAVLAHELGHFKRKHVQKRMIVMAIFSMAGLALLGWLMQQLWFYQGLGVNQPSVHAALMLFLIVAPVFGFFMQPVAAWFSRRDEFEADDYAAQQADASAMIRALVKLYQENASTLTPDALYSAFHDSHPPAPLRVAHLSAKLA